MILSQITKSKIEKVFGKPIRYSSDYYALVIDIEEKISEHIGVNTLKRLMGEMGPTKEPRLSTLDVIAKYIGFENWDIYSLSFRAEGNSEFTTNSKEHNMIQLSSSSLKSGENVEITYYPDRELILKYLGNNSYIVAKSKNSKLNAGDTLAITTFYKDYPLFIPFVKNKNGEERGSFTAGKISGITEIKILK